MAGTPSQVAASPLTRREHEVSRLVLEGLSNKEIAQRLFLSERTVEGHVASICNKLGFHSRVQIAAWAARQSGASAVTSDTPLRRLTLPPWWVLAIMAVGAPLPFVAVIYQWSLPPAAGVPAGAVNVLITLAALAFVAVPAICLVGQAVGREWVRPVAIGGLLAIGSNVLFVGAIAARQPFRAADAFESVYAAALVPLLLLHLVAGVAAIRKAPLSTVLITAVCIVWIVRFGYGLSLGVLVLWLLWSRPGNTEAGQ